MKTVVKGKWKRKIYFAGGKVLSVVNKWIPKDDKKILIFCKGPLYDNSETLFHYLVEHEYHKEYKIVCVVDQPERYKEYFEKNIKFVSLKGALGTIFTAKYNFFHGEMLAIKPTKKQIWVNYWHGTPLKKINHMLHKLGEYDYDFFTYLTAAEKKFMPIMAEAFNCNSNKVILCGHPRNDYLFSKEDELKKLSIEKEKYQKIILWMPTYRKSRDGSIVDTKENYLENGALPIFHSDEKVKELNDFLKKNQSFLIVKFHPAQDLKDFHYHDMSNIKFISNQYLIEHKIVLYKVVKDADCLITDYSSIFFDYLLLDRPIGFTLEDMDSYEDNRGFVFENPLDYMPGEKIEDEDDFKSFILNCLEGIDDYKKERAEVNEKVNHYKDGNNCKRLLEMIGLKKGEMGQIT